MRLAFLFPGQGSQKVGMGKALADAFPAARAVFEEADAALGWSISRLCFEGPEQELLLTAHTQPAILTTSIAALRALQQETGAQPAVVAGHSLGEYSALVAAGAMSLADAVRVVHLRGKFMQEAVAAGTGGMAAVLGLERAELEAACAEAAEGELVSVANLNGGGQIVIAGHKGAVERACAAAKKRGAKRAVPLSVSAPFHCPLMAPAAERLAVELARVEMRQPTVPVISNVEAVPVTDGARARELLVRQVTAPVRWEESMQQLPSLGVTAAVELGCGAVVAGLLKRIVPSLPISSVGDPESLQSYKSASVAG